MLALTTAGSALADNHASDCMIPDSGPWPPCATGGEATDQWSGASSSAGDSDCMIPESGPWPACATGGAAAGGSSADAPMASDGDSGMAASSGTTLIGSMQDLEFLLEQMGGLLDRLHAGSAESCGEYMTYYVSIAALPVYDNLPAEWVDLHNLYIDAATSALESNKDIFLLCEGGGGAPSNLNYGVARSGINASLDKIKAGIAVASEMADAPPAPPAPPADAAPAPAPEEEPAPTPEEPAPPVDAAPALFTAADAQSFVRDSSRIPNAGEALECQTDTVAGTDQEMEICSYLLSNGTAIAVGALAMPSAAEAEEFKAAGLVGIVEILDFTPAGNDTICHPDFLGFPACYRFASNNNLAILIFALSDSVDNASQAVMSVNTAMPR